MSALKVAGLVAGVGALVVLFSSIFTVDEREKALVLRFGEVNRIVEKPGLYFKLPFADEVVDIEDRLFLWSSDNKAVQVSDKQRYLVDTMTVARIMNAQKLGQIFNGRDHVSKPDLMRPCARPMASGPLTRHCLGIAML
jgi:modulator of FtsH protease HflC